jgi:hypothetical protein
VEAESTSGAIEENLDAVVHSSRFMVRGSCSCSVLRSRFFVPGSKEGRVEHEHRTAKCEPRTELEHELRRENPEA